MSWIKIKAFFEENGLQCPEIPFYCVYSADRMKDVFLRIELDRRNPNGFFSKSYESGFWRSTAVSAIIIDTIISKRSERIIITLLDTINSDKDYYEKMLSWLEPRAKTEYLKKNIEIRRKRLSDISEWLK